MNAYEDVKAAVVRAGFHPTRFDSETTLLRTLKRKQFDFLIVDMSSVPIAEDSIFSWLGFRSANSLPSLVLSSQRSAALVAQVLDGGADDFLERPFEPLELVARINALMRRCAPKLIKRTIDYAGFSLHKERSRLTYQGQEIALTPREFSMAWLFFSSPGIYISRETLGTVIWSTDSEIAGRTIEQHIYKLRKKLQVDGRQIVNIRTAYSQGYRLDVFDSQALSEMPAETEISLDSDDLQSGVILPLHRKA